MNIIMGLWSHMELFGGGKRGEGFENMTQITFNHPSKRTTPKRDPQAQGSFSHQS